MSGKESQILQVYDKGPKRNILTIYYANVGHWVLYDIQEKAAETMVSHLTPIPW